jgi:hypothetical protein
MLTEVKLMLTAGHTQLPVRGIAIFSSIAHLVGNPTTKRFGSATAHTREH